MKRWCYFFHSSLFADIVGGDTETRAPYLAWIRHCCPPLTTADLRILLIQIMCHEILRVTCCKLPIKGVSFLT